MKKLKYKKFQGLHIVCKKCGKQIEVSNDEYKGCNHPIEKQRYKAVIRVNGSRKTKDLKSFEYDEAIKELLEFKEELENPISIIIPKQQKVVKHDLLKDCVFMFGDWLENVDVPKHEQKVRTDKYIKECIGYVQRMVDFIGSSGYNLSKFTIYEMNKFIVGEYVEYLMKLTNKATTYNHNIRALKNFYNFLINEKEYVIPNLVKKIKLKYENPDPRSVEDDDLTKILTIIDDSVKNPNIKVYKNGVKKNMYRPYIKTGIELAAYTGMRLEEVAILKYSDLKFNSDGSMAYLEGTDLKFARAHNWDDSKEKKIVYIPITPELGDLFNRLDYKTYINSDKYILDENEHLSRNTVAKQMSHSFSYFRDKAGVSKSISIKHLRKTFLTKLETQTGLTVAAGYQKTANVIHKNYIDKRKIVQEISNRGFGYFKK